MRNFAIAAAVLALASSTGSDAFARDVELKVGQTKQITKYRNTLCTAGAPSFAFVARQLPKSNLVKYSDGGITNHRSNACGKDVPARAVNGTAIKKGKETRRFQEFVTIIVN